MNKYARHLVLMALMNKQRLRVGVAAEFAVGGQHMPLAVIDKGAAQFLIYESILHVEIYYSGSYYTPYTDQITWFDGVSDPTLGWTVIKLTKRDYRYLLHAFQTKEKKMNTPSAVDISDALPEEAEGVDISYDDDRESWEYTGERDES
jgi:hypothetical protein